MTKIRMMATGAEAEVSGSRLFRRRASLFRVMSCRAGMVGYITASIKNVKDTRVGDTVTDADNPCAEALAGL